MRPFSLLAAVLAGAAALAVAGTTFAQSGSLPTRRTGYWETTMTMGGPHHMAMKTMFCTDPTVEQHVSILGHSMTQNMCSKRDVRRTLTGWTFDWVCKTGAMTTSTTASVTGDFQTAYHYEAVSRMSPPPAPGLGETRMVADAKWIGPCPAGRKPGDMVMPGGMVMNIAKTGTQ